MKYINTSLFFRNWIRIIVPLFLLTIPNDSFGQCEPANVTQATYCPGQSAQFVIDDPIAINRYQWFNSETAIVSLLSTNNGRNFTPPGTTNAPQTFYYQRELGSVIGPATSINSGGSVLVNDGVTSYGQNLNSSVDFALNEVSVIVEMPNPGVYDLNVRYIRNAGQPIPDTTFSMPLLVDRSTLTSLGNNLYRVVIPVSNILVENSLDTRIEVVSAADPGGAFQAVTGFYWFGANRFNGDSYLDGAITFENPTLNIAGVNRTPLIMDWNIGIACPRIPVTTTLAPQCCVAVADDFTLTSPINNPQATDFPVTLTAAGPDISPVANFFFYWYDQDGNLLTNGPGLNTYNATMAGQFEVRVVRDVADINNNECFSNKSVILGIQSIFAPDDFTVCVGDPISIRATGSETTYQWEGNSPEATAAIGDPLSQQTQISLAQTGVYTFKVTGDVKLGNIARDGKFEQFNDSDNFDALQPNLRFETTYGIGGGDNGQFINNNNQFRVDDQNFFFSATIDDRFCNSSPTYFTKTNTNPVTNVTSTVSRGNILFADPPATGAGAALSPEFGRDNYVWQLENQPVLPNETYTFAVDVSKWNEGPNPNMMLLINGVAQDLTLNNVPLNATVANISTDTCTWSLLETTYTVPPGQTSVTITIAEVSKDNVGFEYAIDDITFSLGRGPQSDEVVITVNDTCQVLEVRDDSTICAGDQFPLFLKENSGFFVDWTDGSGQVVSTTQNTTAFSAFSQTYTATVRFPEVSYISNGDFETGSLDFIPGLSSTTGSIINRNQYFIGSGNDTRLHNHMLKGFEDHTTGTVAGNSFVGWLDRNVPTTVLERGFTTTAGESYAFSVWVKHLHREPNGANARDYQFDVLLNGVNVQSQTIARGQDWTEIRYDWVSATSGLTNIALVGLADGGELGFAIDDVALAQLGDEVTDQVQLTVDVCTSIDLTDLGCEGDERLVRQVVTNGIFSGWYNDAGDLISTEDTLRVTPSGLETYTALAGVKGAELIENGNMNVSSVDGQALLPNTTQDRSAGFADVRPGDFAFVTNANFRNNGNFPDFTGDGSFLMINTRPGTDVVNYQTLPITVEVGEKYAYSIDLATILNPATVAAFTQFFDLDLLINGDVVGSFNTSAINTWTTFSGVYVPNTGTIELSVVLRGKQRTNEPDPDNQDKVWFAIGVDNVSLTSVLDVISENIEVEPCCLQLAPVIALTTGTGTECVGSSIVLTATPDAASVGPFTFQWYLNGVAIAGANNATYTVPSAAAALQSTYTATLTSSSTCSGESVASNGIAITISPTPTATLTGDTTICAGDMANLSIALTGTGPWDFVYRTPAPVDVPVSSATSPAVVMVSAQGAYGLVSVTDANCDGTVTGTAVVRLANEVTATVSTICTDDTPLGGVVLALDEFQIVVNVTAGDTPTIAVTEPLGTFGVSFTETAAGSGIWFSDAINETNAIDVNVTDVYNCGGGVDAIALNRKCSCADEATLTVSTGFNAEICEEGTATASNTQLTVTLGHGSSPAPADWGFAIVNQDGTILPGQDYRVARYAGPLSFTIPVSDTGVYRIIEFEGSCEGTVSPAINISHYPSPKAILTAPAKICADSSDLGQLELEVLDATFPVTLVVSRTVAGDTTVTLTAADPVPYLGITSLSAETFGLVSLSDDNGCTAKTMDIDTIVQIDTVTAPFTSILLVDADTVEIGPGGIKESFIGSEFINVILDTVNTGFNINWVKNPLHQGDTLNQREDTISIEGLTTNAVFPTDTSFGDDGVTELLVEISDTAGICDTRVDTLKIIKVEAVPPPETDSRTVCETSTAFSYNWTAPSALQTVLGWVDVDGVIATAGDTVVSQSLNFPANQAVGTYTFVYLITNSIDEDTARTVLTVRIDAEPTPASVVLPTIEICGNTTQLNAIPVTVGIGTWTKLSGAPLVTITAGQENLPNATVGAFELGESASFQWSVVNGACDASNVANVTVNRASEITAPNILVNGDLIPESGKVDICITDTPNTIANQGFVAGTEDGQWQIVTGSSIALDETSKALSQPFTLEMVGVTTLSWTVSDLAAVCPDTTRQIQIEIFGELPSPIITNDPLDTTICETETVTINTTTQANGNAYQWFRSDGTLLPGETSPSLQNITGLDAAGGYYMTEDDGGVCGASRTLDFFVFVDEIPLVDANVGNQPIRIDERETGNLNGFSSDVNAFWTSSNGGLGLLADPLDPNSLIIAPLESGGFYWYTLNAVGNLGKCVNSDSVLVNIRSAIIAPNVFTPNGDGQNDFFEVRGLETYERSDMYIYNRWGHEVYRVEGRYVDNLWDGGTVTEGAYYYVIDFGDGLENGHSGVIHVVR